jgi:hypothetical protein
MICTTSEKESIWAYLKGSKMLKVEELFKSVALEALI